MPFTTSELKRIRQELGQNLLETGADVYVRVHQHLEVVVQNFILDEVITTSTTEVTAASPVVPAVITLASATGFTAGDRIFVDVDSRRESLTIQAMTGTSLTGMFSKDHGSHAGAGYSVSLDGPIPIVKDLLSKIANAKAELADTFGEGALKQVDEIKFYDTNRSLFGSTGESLKFWRNEMASALGMPNLWDTTGSDLSTTIY